VLVIGILFLLPFVCIEITSKIVYHYRFNAEEKLVIRARIGMDPNPRMISYYKPHHYMVYMLNHQISNAQQDQSNINSGYFINTLGFRGKEFSRNKPEGTYRIFCIGGSTTFCINEHDQSQTYPQMLENKLNKLYSTPRFEVINAGTPGWTTAESLINLQFRILDLSPDMIIICHAVNDTFAMRRDDEGKSDYSNFRQICRYQQPGTLKKFFLKYSAFYRLFFIYTHEVSADITQMVIKRKPILTDEDANLDHATGKYFKRNMENMVTIAKANNIVPVLVTMGHGPFWHHSLLLNNRITRDITRKKSVLFVDFERIAKPSYFTEDDIHMRRTGNRVLVKSIVDALYKSDLNFVLYKN